MKEIAGIVEKAGLKNYCEPCTHIRLVNPPKTKNVLERQTLIEVEPLTEIRVYSLLSGTVEDVARRAIMDAMQQIANLLSKKSVTHKGQLSYVAYLISDDGTWEIYRRQRLYRDQKYRTSQKFSSAFKPNCTLGHLRAGC